MSIWRWAWLLQISILWWRVGPPPPAGLGNLPLGVRLSPTLINTYFFRQLFLSLQKAFSWADCLKEQSWKFSWSDWAKNVVINGLWLTCYLSFSSQLNLVFGSFFKSGKSKPGGPTLGRLLPLFFCFLWFRCFLCFFWIIKLGWKVKRSNWSTFIRIGKHVCRNMSQPHRNGGSHCFIYKNLSVKMKRRANGVWSDQ